MKYQSLILYFIVFTATSFAEIQIEFGGSLEATYYHTDTPAPGLLKQNSEDFFAPRLETSLDLLFNNYWYFHATARYDRGFDAGDRDEGEIRLDEALLRYRPFGDDSLNIQIGKTATIFGAYVNNHRFHDNPFITAPLPYDQIIGVNVVNPNSTSRSAIAGRASGTLPGIFETAKRPWAATVWGPAYSTGITVTGTIERFDYAAEIKNVDISAHPDQWNPDAEEFEHPSFSLRLGYRPSVAWNLGLSFSQGPYLNADSQDLLPDGLNRGDLLHRAIGIDVSWAHRDFIISGEIIANQYETLEAGDLKSLTSYIQARWKAAPGFWLATRVGHTLNNTITGPSGESLEWSPNLWRFEVASGFRITEDTLIKAQYNYTHTEGDSPGPGENLYALAVSYRF